jgi:hypothetical protein
MSDIQLLDDYTKATFPCEVTFGNGQKVRLYAAFGDRVVGVSYYSWERDGEVIETLGQVLDWDSQGRFGQSGASYPEMDLVPPPAKLAEGIARFEAEIAKAQARLDANPNAPEAWRSVDQRLVREMHDRIENLTALRASFAS